LLTSASAADVEKVCVGARRPVVDIGFTGPEQDVKLLHQVHFTSTWCRAGFSTTTTTTTSVAPLAVHRQQ
jgi:hypothetical protein